MDIEEAKQKKVELEREISKLIHAFSSETGLIVSEMNLIDVSNVNGTQYYSFNAKVEL